MEIILTKDIDNLGLTGQVLKVAPGYARNYLLPQGAALLATESNLKLLAKKRAEFETRSKLAKEEALDRKNQLAGVSLIISRKSGDKGKLYGAVTVLDIVEEAKNKGLTLDRRRIRLSDPIKALGDYEVPIRLHQDVIASLKVKVIQEGSDANPEQESNKNEETKTVS